MEKALASLDTWFQANGLKVNAAKTQLMLLGSPQNLRSLNGIQVEFRGHHLVPISEAKNLGIIFDQSLSWDRQVSSVTQRCFGVLTGLSHLRGHLPTAVLSALINTLVFSQIRYCISVYGNGKKGNLNRLQKVVNYAAKVLFGRRKYDHVSDLLGRLGWLSAEGMATYHTLYLIHKVRRYGEPEQLAAGLSTVAEARATERTTRRDQTLYVPRSRTEMGRRRFVCRGPARYNALPRELVAMVPRFCRRVRQHLAAAPPTPDWLTRRSYADVCGVNCIFWPSGCKWVVVDVSGCKGCVREWFFTRMYCMRVKTVPIVFLKNLTRGRNSRYLCGWPQ